MEGDVVYFIGLLIGAILGLTGAGGSVFAVPLLIFGLGLSLQQAIGISLAAVSICAAYGVLIRLKGQQIQWLTALIFAGMGSILAPLGNHLNRLLEPAVLLPSFALLVMVVAWRMWSQAQHQPQQTHAVRATGANREQDVSPVPAADILVAQAAAPLSFKMLALGALAGLLSGLFGVGGGFLIVPSLLYLTAMTMTQAVATSLFIIALVSGSGFIAFLTWGQALPLSLVMQIALGGIVGMTLGVLCSDKLAGPTLQKTFAVLMLLIALGVLLQSFFSGSG